MAVPPALVDVGQPGELLQLPGQFHHPGLQRGRHVEHLQADRDDLGETGKDDVIAPAWLMLFLN